MRLYRFVAYFTIESNLLVAIASVSLAIDPVRDGTTWRVVRLAGIVGIAITAVVHFFLLRPLLDLEGWGAVLVAVLAITALFLALFGAAAWWDRRSPAPLPRA